MVGGHHIPRKRHHFRGNQRKVAPKQHERRAGPAVENFPQPSKCHRGDIRHQHRLRQTKRVSLLHRKRRRHEERRSQDLASEYLRREQSHQRESPPEAAHTLRADSVGTEAPHHHNRGDAGLPHPGDDLQELLATGQLHRRMRRIRRKTH